MHLRSLLNRSITDAKLEEINGDAAAAWITQQNNRTLKTFANYKEIATILDSMRDSEIATKKIYNTSEIQSDNKFIYQKCGSSWQKASLHTFNHNYIPWRPLRDISKLPNNVLTLSDDDDDDNDYTSDDENEYGFVQRDRDIYFLSADESIKKEQLVYQGAESDFDLILYKGQAENILYHYIIRHITYALSEFYLINHDLTLTKLPLPTASELKYHHGHYGIFLIKENWHPDKYNYYYQGSLIALNIQNFKTKHYINAEVLFKPTASMAFNEVVIINNYSFIITLNNVSTEIFNLTKKNNHWHSKPIPIPTFGVAKPIAAVNKKFIFEYENLSLPKSLLFYDETKKISNLIKTPSIFDNTKVKTTQYFATSADGTRIPYFIMHKTDLVYDCTNPTLLSGYGGFGNSSLPCHAKELERLWVLESGVYVLANIRGGNEYGSAWHKAAVKENRYKAFEDFIAIAEDLISRKITSPKKIGIYGASNGGLLTAVSFISRPDLFNAVICHNPLLDMLNFHKLNKATFWEDEFGNPDDKNIQEVIKQYSPYENVKKDAKYPPILFLNNSDDAIVHPAHARKMAHKMQEMGHEIYYYEEKTGGHCSADDYYIWNKAHGIIFAYLKKQLMSLAVKKTNTNTSVNFFKHTNKRNRMEITEAPQKKLRI